MSNTCSNRLGLKRFGEKPEDIIPFESMAGLCIVGQEVSGGTIVPRCTGSIVPCRGSIVLVTSETIFPEKELATVKRHCRKWTEFGFVLTFKKKGKAEKTNTFKLQELTGSKEAVIFDQGLIIIPLDSQKASGKLKEYCRFKANYEKIPDAKPFNGSICRFVNFPSGRFEVETYKIIYDQKDKLGLCRLIGSTSSLIYTLAELAPPTSSRLPFGGGIFKNDTFVGVLIFHGEQISPVQCWLGKLIGTYGRTFEEIPSTLL